MSNEGWPWNQTRGGNSGKLKATTGTPTQYTTLAQVREDLRAAGFEACELIVAVDFTMSNRWTGKGSFDGRCLHDVRGPPNPYYAALELVAGTLNVHDDDHMIPCYGFGDNTTKEEFVFSFFPDNRPANGLPALLNRYKEIAPIVDLAGPTTFAPVIRQAMRDVYNFGMKLHILLIIADGQVSNECIDDTKNAILEATAFPLCIVVIGVGDGPWEEMERFDCMPLPERHWDNFKFINFNDFVTGNTNVLEGSKKEQFEMKVLEELAKQYHLVRNLTGERNKSAVEEVVNSIPQNVVINPPDFA